MLAKQSLDDLERLGLVSNRGERPLRRVTEVAGGGVVSLSALRPGLGVGRGTPGVRPAGVFHRWQGVVRPGDQPVLVRELWFWVRIGHDESSSRKLEGFHAGSVPNPR